VSFTNGTYTRPDGDTVVLPDDPVTRAQYERKGFVYGGPVKEIAGNTHENAGRDGSLDAQGNIVEQAAEVVLAKMSGTYSAEDNAAEQAKQREFMFKLGSFPMAVVDLPESLRPKTEPLPPPVAPSSSPTDGAGAPGMATDGTSATGAPDLSAQTTDGATLVAHAGSPGTFDGPVPALKSDLDRATADPSGPWPEGQYVRVNSRDYTWNGSAWVTATVTAAPTA
jgi:hypothetical protein